MVAATQRPLVVRDPTAAPKRRVRALADPYEYRGADHTVAVLDNEKLKLVPLTTSQTHMGRCTGLRVSALLLRTGAEPISP